MRAHDQTCIKRDNVHKIAEAKQFFQQNPSDFQFRKRYCRVYKQFAGVITGLSMDIYSPCIIRNFFNVSDTPTGF